MRCAGLREATLIQKLVKSDPCLRQSWALSNDQAGPFVAHWPLQMPDFCAIWGPAGPHRSPQQWPKTGPKLTKRGGIHTKRGLIGVLKCVRLKI